MPTPFAQALLDAQLIFAQEAGESVDLWRSGNTTSDVEAVPGKNDQESTNYDGVTRTLRIQVFLIKVEDYVISGTEVKPQEFDRIIWTVNGKVLTFEAQPFAADDAVFEYTDSYRTHYRIFCKQIDEDDV